MWAAGKFGGRVADETFNKVRDKQRNNGELKQQERLAQDLARARGWKYLQHVVDGKQRWVVFNEDKKPVAAFPPVEGATTPDALAQRVELDGFVPTDVQLKTPPAQGQG
jgi:hypothetical protein